MSRSAWREAVAKLGLNHVVITSVDRDDLVDGGARAFRRDDPRDPRRTPTTTIEVLTPDFLRKDGALEIVVAASPDVFNHNLETVPRLYLKVRPGRALLPLAAAAAAGEGTRSRRCSPSPASWSGWARSGTKCCR